MIVFGVDPGSHRTGWGVVRAQGSRFEWLASGVIKLRSTDPLDERLEPIFAALSELMLAHKPDRFALESVFTHKNPRSALVLGHARGVALLAARSWGCPVIEISPAEVKKAVTGSGRAEKVQVQAMIKVLLGRASQPQADEADALAVAIAGSIRSQSPLAALVAGKRR